MTTIPSPQQGAPTRESELSHEIYRSGRVPHLLRPEFAPLLPAGLDPAAAQLLAWLVKQGPARQADLAEETALDPSTVSRRIGQLVSHRLVERQADPHDGRAARLAATPAGVELFGRMREVRNRVLADLLAEWSDEDLNALTGLLRRFNDTVDGRRRTTISRGTTRGEP